MDNSRTLEWTVLSSQLFSFTFTFLVEIHQYLSIREGLCRPWTCYVGRLSRFVREFRQKKIAQAGLTSQS